MTTERRDIAGEHITVDEQAALCVQYKIAPKVMTTIVREQAHVDIWKELGHMKHQCLICDQIVDGTRPGGYRAHNTNFGRVSHGKKHLNDGSALSLWGGADGIRVMPSRVAIVKEIERKIRQVQIDKDLPKLRAERKPFVEARRTLIGDRDAIERVLIAAIRKDGAVVSKDASFKGRAADVRGFTKEIEKLHAKLDAIGEKYDEAVINQLTGRDG